MKIETRSVLEMAYPRRRKTETMLTHSVEFGERAGVRVRVLCNRVDLESMCDGGAMDLGGESAQPTCPRCLAKDPRFQRSN